MLSRRRALNAGRLLNDVADAYEKRVAVGKTEAEEARRIRQAVQDANAVMFQYYLIPRDIRANYERKELFQDGIHMHTPSESGV